MVLCYQVFLSNQAQPLLRGIYFIGSAVNHRYRSGNVEPVSPNDNIALFERVIVGRGPRIVTSRRGELDAGVPVIDRKNFVASPVSVGISANLFDRH